MKIFTHVIIYLYILICCSVVIALMFHQHAQKLYVPCICKGCPKARFKTKCTIHTERKYSQRPLYERHHMPRYVQNLGWSLDILMCTLELTGPPQPTCGQSVLQWRGLGREVNPNAVHSLFWHHSQNMTEIKP